jgi:hypothetical protein
MIYIGKVANGTVILPPDMQLPDGTQVRIAPLVPMPHVTRRDQVADLQEIAAGLTDLPEDMARQHDHYLYGTPRQ